MQAVLVPRITVAGYRPEIMQYMGKDAYTSNNRVQLVKGGQDYFKVLHELVHKAQQVLYLHFYIYTDDETGRELKAALLEAAGRGVQIYLMVDGYASQNLPQHFADEFREAGIRFKWFEPLFRSSKFYLGRRMHYKVVVADGSWSLVGGININNHYNDLPGKPAWMDLALFCEGEVAAQLQLLCRSMWNRIPAGKGLAIPQKTDAFPGSQLVQEVRIRRNDWVKHRNEITRSYLHMLLHAKKEILIMCSYFLPGRVFRREIANAAKRGVRIRVILAGPSDVMVAKHAERYLYDWMLKNGIGIYEYQQNVLHAKTAVYDGCWATIGSYNVNNISAYASLELNIDVQDEKFAGEMTRLMEKIIAEDCQQITRDNYASSRNLFRRFWQRACYSFINTVLSLFTFYFKQEE